MTGTTLDALAAHAREHVKEKKRELPFAELKWQLREREALSGFPFGAALQEPGPSVVAEVKKASPSKGVIIGHLPYLEIAKVYETAEASCISALTEPKWFLGDDRYLREIAAAVSLPCVRKDFAVDPYLTHGMRELGASTVLLICALLGQSEFEEYLGITERLELSALVEAHNGKEVRKVAEVEARLIGVNNYDLKSFSVNMKSSLRFRIATPDSCIFIAGNGVRTPADMRILRTVSADGILVGGALMRAESKAELLQALRKGYKGA